MDGGAPNASRVSLLLRSHLNNALRSHEGVLVAEPPVGSAHACQPCGCGWAGAVTALFYSHSCPTLPALFCCSGSVELEYKYVVRHERDKTAVRWKEGGNFYLQVPPKGELRVRDTWDESAREVEVRCLHAFTRLAKLIELKLEIEAAWQHSWCF